MAEKTFFIVFESIGKSLALCKNLASLANYFKIITLKRLLNPIHIETKFGILKKKKRIWIYSFTR